MLERLAADNVKDVKIVKVDVMEEQNWALDENVRTLPDLRFYEFGKEVYRLSGEIDEAEIQKKIDYYALPEAERLVIDAAEPSIKPMPSDWLPPGVSKG